MNKDATYMDRLMLMLAREVARSSQDPSTQVGAVLTRPDGSVAGTGYNRFPFGHPNLTEHYHDRAHKYEHIWHAEDWLFNLMNSRLEGFSLYTSFPVCPRCMGKAAGLGLTRAVFPPLPREGKDAAWIEQWEGLLAESLRVAAHGGVMVDIIHV